MQENRVIVVAGPTASGKSGLALDLAAALNGEVVNADSMQVYKDMPIITACPGREDRAKVPHHLYEIYDPSVNGTVVDWLERAVSKIREIWARGGLPIAVGGTGMYIDNLINGTTPIPEADAAIRREVRLMQQREGTPALHEKLGKADAETAARLSPNDTTRVTRAYEVWMQTGLPLSEWHKKPMVKKIPEARFKVVKICPQTVELDARCYRRFDEMIQAGAEDEVRRLLSRNLPENLPAMKALGVPEIGAYVRGECSLSEAVELGKLHTRQYAKRQRTWFANKLRADLRLDECYVGRKNLINDVKKIL